MFVQGVRRSASCCGPSAEPVSTALVPNVKARPSVCFPSSPVSPKIRRECPPRWVRPVRVAPAPLPVASVAVHLRTSYKGRDLQTQAYINMGSRQHHGHNDGVFFLTKFPFDGIVELSKGGVGGV